MRANQADFRTAMIARVPGAPRGTSGFYAWRERGRSVKEHDDKTLTARVRAIRADSQEVGDRVGRIHTEMAEQGLPVNHKRTARVMRQAGLAKVNRRKGPHTTLRDAQARPAPKLVERERHTDAPN